MQMAKIKEKRMKKADTGVKKAAKSRLLPIIICSFLALVLLFGAVMGTVMIVREVGAYVSYNGVTLDEGVTSYLASTFKASYKGDDLEGALERYLRAIAVAVYLYDRNAALAESDREWINTNVGEILDYKAGNDKKQFNEAAAPMGFDYSDFKRATEIIYKAAHSKLAIYGEGGVKLASQSGISSLNEYFKEYSHVKILFVRLEDKFVLDEAGNRVRGEDGNDMTVLLTPDEKAKVEADVLEIAELIERVNSGEAQFGTAEFDEYYKIYNDDPTNASGGYYFSKNSAFTAEYREAYPNLVEKILTMETGELGSSTDGSTFCFIYKYENKALDYAAGATEHFFGDFYSDAADYLFDKALSELSKEVSVKDKFYALDIDGLKKNSLFKTSLGIGVKVG